MNWLQGLKSRDALAWGMAIVIHAVASAVMFFVSRFALRTYETVFPDEVLPRLTEASIGLRWLFPALLILMVGCFLHAAGRGRWSMMSLVILLLVDVAAMAFSIYGLFLPFALTTRW